VADTGRIPVIDLGPYLAVVPEAGARTARELRHALTEIGFYFIVNHGIPPGQIREVFARPRVSTRSRLRQVPPTPPNRT
jgi:isopenicillin N synthase-like dioxygenase